MMSTILRDEAVIEAYLARVNTLDKAGGYGIQGLAAVFAVRTGDGARTHLSAMAQAMTG